MAFPESLTNAVDGVTEIVADHLNNLERKVGVDNSTDPSSLDYLLRSASSSNPGHRHTLAHGATDVTASAAELNLLDLSGLTVGQVLRATGASSAAWGNIQEGDLPDLSAYVKLDGRSGGQTIYGGTRAGENLTLSSTAHATKGAITLDNTLIVSSGRVGIGVTPSVAALEVAGDVRLSGNVTLSADRTYTLGNASYRLLGLYSASIVGNTTATDVSNTQIYNGYYGLNYATAGTYYNRGLYLNYYINADAAYASGGNSGYDRACYVVSLLRRNTGTIAELTGIRVEYGAYGPGGADVSGTIINCYGLSIVGQIRASTTITNNYGIRIVGVSGSNAWGIYQADTGIKNFFGSSVIIGSTAAIGSSAAKVLAIGSGTAPTSAPADAAQLWVEDVNGVAGKASLHMMSESGTNKLVVAGIILKGDAGDPSQVHEGLLVINTADKAVKIYAGGAWRTLTTWS